MYSLKKVLQTLAERLKIDYIVEQGTSDIWTYRKWASGILEQWGTVTINGSWSAWDGNIYVLNGSTTNYAVPFHNSQRPVVNLGYKTPLTGKASAWVGIYSSANELTAVRPAVYRPSAGTDGIDYYITVYARGLWKALTDVVGE